MVVEEVWGSEKLFGTLVVLKNLPRLGIALSGRLGQFLIDGQQGPRSQQPLRGSEGWLRAQSFQAQLGGDHSIGAQVLQDLARQERRFSGGFFELLPYGRWNFRQLQRRGWIRIAGCQPNQHTCAHEKVFEVVFHSMRDRLIQRVISPFTI